MPQPRRWATRGPRRSNGQLRPSLLPAGAQFIKWRKCRHRCTCRRRRRRLAEAPPCRRTSRQPRWRRPAGTRRCRMSSPRKAESNAAAQHRLQVANKRGEWRGHGATRAAAAAGAAASAAYVFLASCLPVAVAQRRRRSAAGLTRAQAQIVFEPPQVGPRIARLRAGGGLPVRIRRLGLGVGGGGVAADSDWGGGWALGGGSG